MVTARPKIPNQVQTQLLRRSRRRCALCFGLEGDCATKKGQIAHLDRDRTNNALENLCWLCLEHHDEYDTKTSQAKGLTRDEVRACRDALYAALPNILAGGPSKAESLHRVERVVQTMGSTRLAIGSIRGDVRIAHLGEHSEVPWWERLNAPVFAYEIGMVRDDACFDWKLRHVSGERPNVVSFRFRRSSEHTEWRTYSISVLDRVHVAGDFLSLSPGLADHRVPPGHVGLEIRFEWHGRICYELCLWELNSRPCGNGWKVGPPVLSPQRWTEADSSTTKWQVKVESDGFIWTRGYPLRSDSIPTVKVAQPECRDHGLRLLYRPHGGEPRPLQPNDTGTEGSLHCAGPDDVSSHDVGWFSISKTFQAAQDRAEIRMKDAIRLS
jgi:hypothetical protein